MKTSNNRIVSSEQEKLILVDREDREIGSLDKASCHDGAGVLHRAFSLFIFNADGDLLLQQRSAAKRLWPLYWSNSCCSHPRLGETMEQATARRLREELNIDARLEFVYKFAYEARFDATGSENELCWVYLGRSEQAIVANDSEIAATRAISAKDLQAEFVSRPQTFTPWFKLEWQRLKRHHASALRPYMKPRNVAATEN